MELCSDTCIPSLYGTHAGVADSVAGAWLAARLKWEMLIAVKFWLAVHFSFRTMKP